jgi:hypothetical protein
VKAFRPWHWLAAAALLVALAGCGSEDNGGVIEGPSQGPASTAPQSPGTSSGYYYE